MTSTRPRNGWKWSQAFGKGYGYEARFVRRPTVRWTSWAERRSRLAVRASLPLPL